MAVAPALAVALSAMPRASSLSLKLTPLTLPNSMDISTVAGESKAIDLPLAHQSTLLSDVRDWKDGAQ